MLVHLLREFDRSRFRHAVVTLRHAGNLSARLPDDVPCFPMHARGTSRLAWWRLARHLRQLRPAVLHARGIGCWADAIAASLLMRRCRLLLGFHGTDRAADLDIHEERKARLGRWCGAHFATVAQSGARLLARRAGIPADRIAVLTNGVDPEGHATDSRVRHALRNQLGLPSEAVLFGTVCSLSWIKGPDQLLEAFTSASGNPETHLVLVGDGPMRPELAFRSAQSGIAGRVHLVGAQNDVWKWLSAMDVFVCPSRSESLSNALLEALAAGSPVITTDVGDHALVVRDGCEGRVVAAGDIAGLAAAMLEIAEDSGLRARMGHAARQRAAHYSFRACLRNYEQLYRSLTTGPGPRVANDSNRTPVLWVR